MNLRDSAELAAFRERVRAWLHGNLPAGWGTPECPEPTSAEARVEFARHWQRRLFEGGWAGLDWPRAWGGRALGVLEQMVFQEEYARARAPDLIPLSVGTSLVGPTLIAHGSDAQKQRFLAPILRGEALWCQGFSEPGAGSDLAGLRTRAELRGDRFVVTGQKIWTSFARHADWCIAVVRSDAEAPRHRGLSFLLVDMGSPGIRIRPLREMTGESWFNEVFFDSVEVPTDNLVGGLHRGWDVVRTTLSHERGSSSQHARLAAELERLIALARRMRRGGRPASADPLVRQALARHATEVSILRMSAWRAACRTAERGAPGPEGSTLKLFWSEVDQRLRETAIDLLGQDGLVTRGDPDAVDAGHWCHEWLWSRAATIYAGTSEIQRNIIAQRVLELPR